MRREGDREIQRAHTVTSACVHDLSATASTRRSSEVRPYQDHDSERERLDEGGARTKSHLSAVEDACDATKPCAAAAEYMLQVSRVILCSWKSTLICLYAQAQSCMPVGVYAMQKGSTLAERAELAVRMEA